MTDLEMLIEIKENGNLKVTEELWNKYQNKVKSSYFTNKRYFDIVGISMEDYFQESFLSFSDCIDYINIEKMKSSKANFGTSFYFFLLKIKNKSQREVNRMGIPIYLSEFSKERDEDESRSSSLDKRYNDVSSVKFDSQLEKRTVKNLVQDYIESQPETYKQILQMFIADFSIKEIAEMVAMKYGVVYNYIRQTKNTLTLMFNNSIA